MKTGMCAHFLWLVINSKHKSRYQILLESPESSGEGIRLEKSRVEFRTQVR